MRIVSVLLLVSCSPPSVVGAPADLFAGPEVQPDATLPPPTVVSIDIRPVVDIRSDFDVTVSDLEPGEVVRVVTGSEPGIGPCHAMIGGYCMSMVRPLAVVGMPVADGDGVAVSTHSAPPWVVPVLSGGGGSGSRGDLHRALGGGVRLLLRGRRRRHGVP